MKQYTYRAGSPTPFGTTVTTRGINFSLFSRHATSIELLLYQAADSREPFQVILLDPELNRTFFFWHIFIENLPAGVHYTWRADGPNDIVATGRRFNPRRELIQPACQAVTDAVWSRARASDPHDGSHTSLRSVVPKVAFDWGDEKRVKQGLEGAVIYEMHVGGFTRHPSAGVEHPGKFAGLIEKIPYLKELGITHVELLPVMAFDEQDAPAAVMDRGLKNYWGYSTHSFFSPHPGYCLTPELGTNPQEFKAMVKALHEAGIGVILDVVFNHTAEGNDVGPMINFKGLANDIFYHLDPADRRRYRDYTGCGNTVNCNHPLVTLFILRCLEYWVDVMHVDGFRFDLASVFTRGEDGAPLANPPLPWSIEFSRSLLGLPLIAEAWDAAGLYQVGAFPGMRWAEWNGRYRDTIRRFVRGDPGILGEVATCIAGSADLFAPERRLPTNSINFITCHDGFTLYDLVSYNRKHNENNGEDNRDGSDHNLSWNCGIEGDTDEEDVLHLRHRQAKNLVAILMLSLGVPMILSGDEVLRTQKGNNNTWCQDNEFSWFDWGLQETHGHMFRFVKEMIALRRRHPNLTRKTYLTGETIKGRDLPDIIWHGDRLGEPDWNDGNARVLAFTLAGLSEEEEDLHVILNMSERAMNMELPKICGRHWHLAVDTSQPPNKDIHARESQTLHRGAFYDSAARSVAVLEARSGNP